MTLEAVSVIGLTNLLSPLEIILKKVESLEFFEKLLRIDDIFDGISNRYSIPLVIVSPALSENSQIYPNMEDRIDDETVDIIAVKILPTASLPPPSTPRAPQSRFAVTPQSSLIASRRRSLEATPERSSTRKPLWPSSTLKG